MGRNGLNGRVSGAEWVALGNSSFTMYESVRVRLEPDDRTTRPRPDQARPGTELIFAL